MLRESTNAVVALRSSVGGAFHIFHLDVIVKLTLWGREFVISLRWELCCRASSFCFLYCIYFFFSACKMREYLKMNLLLMHFEFSSSKIVFLLLVSIFVALDHLVALSKMITTLTTQITATSWSFC